MIRSWPRNTRTLNPVYWGDETSAARLRGFTASGNTQAATSVVPVQANGWGGTPSPAVGSLWESRSAPDLAWASMAWSPQLGIFCIIGGSSLATSPDGVTWTPSTFTSSSVTSICWSPELGLFCAVRSAGTPTGTRALTSPDGVTWTTRTSAADNTWNAVCWSPELGLFAAVASTGAGNRVMTSPDGVTWTTQTSAEDNNWTSICWSPELGIFCAGALNGLTTLIMTSPDGVTWTGRAHASSTTADNICWSPELGIFLYIGTGSAISSDGINWRSTGSVSSTISDLIWVRELNRFYAVDSTSGFVYSSPDGSNWTRHPVAGAQSWNTIRWSPELKMLCAVASTGTGNRIMTSSDFVLMP